MKRRHEDISEEEKEERKYVLRALHNTGVFAQCRREINEIFWNRFNIECKLLCTENPSVNVKEKRGILKAMALHDEESKSEVMKLKGTTEEFVRKYVKFEEEFKNERAASQLSFNVTPFYNLEQSFSSAESASMSFDGETSAFDTSFERDMGELKARTSTPKRLCKKKENRRKVKVEGIILQKRFTKMTISDEDLFPESDTN